MKDSIIGTRIVWEAPVDNDKTETGEGVIIDRFTMPVVAPKSGQLMMYENYLLKKDDGTVTTINPTLVTRVID